MLDQTESLPDGFLQVSSREIQRVVRRPTLIHLPGRRPEPVFVSILQHGNEDVGLKAVQRLLIQMEGRRLPRALSIFVGNVQSATLGVRRLEGQPDYNRVWPGSDQPPSPLHDVMAEVVSEMARRSVFVSIDLHNNTGRNPHYACVCSTDFQHLQLAAQYSGTVVYFTRPKGVQTMAFTPLCPSVTCECGKVGDETGVIDAARLLEKCLMADAIPEQFPERPDLKVFHTVATVKIPDDVLFGFEDQPGDLLFPADLDTWNFREIGVGSEIATRADHSDASLIVIDEQGQDRHDHFISIVGNSLRLRRQVLPSMLTLDPRIIRQDCLCYFMERWSPPGLATSSA